MGVSFSRLHHVSAKTVPLSDMSQRALSLHSAFSFKN